MGGHRDDDTALALRLTVIRRELFGEHGGPHLAGLLGIPAGSWCALEAGHPVPADVLLRFIAVTGADPRWLRTGTGPRYRTVATRSIPALPADDAPPAGEGPRFP